MMTAWHSVSVVGSGGVEEGVVASGITIILSTCDTTGTNRNMIQPGLRREQRRRRFAELNSIPLMINDNCVTSISVCT